MEQLPTGDSGGLRPAYLFNQLLLTEKILWLRIRRGGEGQQPDGLFWLTI
jgi:hypothetical protein